MNLSRKIGPLPLYAWLVIGVAGVVAGLWLKNRLAASSSLAGSSAVPATATGGTSYPDLGAASGGGASGIAPVTYGPSDVTGAYSAGLADASTSLSNAFALIGQAQGLLQPGASAVSQGNGGTFAPSDTGSNGGAPAAGTQAVGASSTAKAITGTAAGIVKTLVNPKTGVQFRVLANNTVEEKAPGGTWYVANRTGKLPTGLKVTG